MAVDMPFFILRGVMVITVGCVGLVGNILTMVVMSRRRMRSSINCLLLGMVACDIVFLFTYILVYGLRAIYPYSGSQILFHYQYHVYPHLVPILYPLAKSAQTMSVYLTVFVTLERWVAVCHPFRASSVCTHSNARWCVLGTAVFALAYGAPRFFEYVVEPSQLNNQTVYNANFKKGFYSDSYHLIYRHYMYTIVMYVVPFTALIVFNFCIVREVWQSRAKRAAMTGVQQREIRLAIMLLVIVVVFFACNLLPLVRNSLYVSGILGGKEALIYTSDLLLTVNHAVNFVIYAIFSENFRNAFVETFCACKSPFQGVGPVPTPPSKKSNTTNSSSAGSGNSGKCVETANL